MKVIYDRETDTLTVILADTPVAEWPGNRGPRQRLPE